MMTYSEKLIKVEFIGKMFTNCQTLPFEHENKKELIRYYGEMFDLIWLFTNDENSFDKYTGDE